MTSWSASGDGSSNMAPQPDYAPPIVHAIGGGVGSALALLLFYPLERARIEMQSHALNDGQGTDYTGLFQRDENDERQYLNTSFEKFETPEEGNFSQHETRVDSPSSWVECNTGHEEHASTEEMRQGDDSWSLSSCVNADETAATSTKEGLAQCLCRLSARRELYRGVSPVICTMAASNFVFFYAHAAMKRAILSDSSKSIGKSLLASTLAGIVNVLVTNPMWVANIRIVQGESKSSSLVKEMKCIMKDEGLSHLWNGTMASLLLVSNPVIQFFTYEQLKTALLNERRKNPKTSTITRLSPIEAFVLGAFAKGLATVLTYPMQLAQVLLRLQHKKQTQEDKSSAGVEYEYKGTLDCFQKLYRAGGVASLFKGMNAKLLQTVLTAAFTFLTYEQILRLVRTTFWIVASRRLDSSSRKVKR